MKQIIAVTVSLLALTMIGCAHNGHKGHHDHHGKKNGCWGKKWEMMDTNKDGAISKSEFRIVPKGLSLLIIMCCILGGNSTLHTIGSNV